MPTVSIGIYYWLFRGAPVLEDFADRLSHVWTVGLLLLCACILSWKQLSFNDPISCWAPATFTDAMVAYAHQTCWNSYRLYKPVSEKYMPTVDQRVPVMWMYKIMQLVLCLQALLFKFPSILMYVLHGYSGLNFDKISSLTFGYEHLNLTERALLGKQTGRYLYNWCKQSVVCLPWRVLSIIWLFVKLLFVANALVQFVLVDKLLSLRSPPFDNSTSYGDTIFDNLFNSSALGWKQTPIFPRKVMCAYTVRVLRVQDYAVQCDLPINEYNEHVYMFIWIWLLLVVIISFVSLAVWLVRTLIPIPRQRYITKMMELSDAPNISHASGSINLARLIGEDGVMVLKLISFNSSEHLVRDVVFTMYQLAQRQSPYSYSPDATQQESMPAIQPCACVPLQHHDAGHSDHLSPILRIRKPSFAEEFRMDAGLSFPSVETQQTTAVTLDYEQIP